MIISDPRGYQLIYASGTAAMSGTINNTALSQVTSYPGDKAVARITDSSHGIAAGSSLFFADIKTSGSYDSNAMRYIMGVATNTMDVLVPEGYTAATPNGEVWCAGWTSKNPFLFVGFRLHLSAAEASGETLTLTRDAYKGSAWDDLILSQAMIGLTDINYMPDNPMPMDANDILKFAWTNTGTKTWGLTLIVAPLAA